MSKVHVVKEMRTPALALVLVLGLLAPVAQAQSGGTSAPPTPPDAPTAPPDAPTATPASDIKASTPNRAARLAPEESAAPGQPPYTVSAGRLTGFGLLGVPLTWGAASGAAFAAGVGGFVLALSATGSSTTSSDLGVPLGISFAAGSLVGVLITYYMLPGMMALFCDDAKMAGSVQAARDAGWQLGRWGVLGMAVTSAGMIAGGLLNNQGMFTASLLGWLVSYLIAWGMEIGGVMDGYKQSYAPRAPPSGAVPGGAVPSSDPRL